MFPRNPQHRRLRYKEQRRAVGTWLLTDERTKLYALAEASGVSTAVYLRAIIADVLADYCDDHSEPAGPVKRKYNYNVRNDEQCRPITTWLLTDERDKLHQLANIRGLTVSGYLRVVLADVFLEELPTHQGQQGPALRAVS